MSLMTLMLLIDKIENHFISADSKGFKKTHLLMSAGINSGNFFRAMRGEIGFADDMLRRLASIPQLETSYEELLVLKLIDEYGFSTMQAVFQEFARIENKIKDG